MTEEWRVIEDFPYYEVSNLGRVRRLHGGQGAVAGRVLTWHTATSTGYPNVRLASHGRACGVNVHKLVSRAFLGPKPEGLQVRHLDGCKDNARADNLAYGTALENRRDRAVHGRDIVGWKLEPSQVRAIREMRAAGASAVDLARMYEVSVSHVRHIVNRRVWKVAHAGA